MTPESIMTKKVSVLELMRISGVSFGTSGARGRVTEMNDYVCYSYTMAFLQYLLDKKEIKTGSNVGIAGDLRSSTDRIMNAVASAIVDMGFHPVNCGKIPSPAVAFYGLQNKIPSIMVTGSHIPDDRNGIKFNKPTGEILKDDEEEICSQFINLPIGLFSNSGEFSVPKINIGEVDSEASDIYIQRYLDFFKPGCLSGMKVGLYEHSGVGRDILFKLLHELGANVVRLGRSEIFMPVDTEAIREEDIALARNWTKEHKLDAIVSTDGDADRPLVGTEKGEWLRGDIAGLLCAAYLNIHHVVTPVSSNSVVDHCGLFETVEKTKIGSPYVIHGMQKIANEKNGLVAGYEANGGFLLESTIKQDGHTLDALPTRDAAIVILSLLVSAHSKRKDLSALTKKLPESFTTSNRIKEFPTKLSCEYISSLTDGIKFDAIEDEFGGICGKVKFIDLTDGLRIVFYNNEIIHLRPSGNAPEFRCYNEAGSLSRVEEINIACINQINKWFSQTMLNA